MMQERFNIRVYGLLINDRAEVLVSDEYRFGKRMTKFPGGGLEHGEGTIECVKREFIEELDTPIEVLEHFYTTDFYQPSAFRNTDQIISIYYRVRNAVPLTVPIRTVPFDFDVLEEEAQVFRWLPLKGLAQAGITFPIDRHVAALLEGVG